MLLNGTGPAPDPRPAAPSDWVLRWAPVAAPPGACVLDLACGRGRHALALAARGAHVVAVDRDARVLEALREAAAAPLPAVDAARGPGQPAGTLAVEQADLEGEAWPLAGRTFDAVIVTNYLWRPRFDALLATVAPGGWLVYETFADGQQALGRPSRPEFLLQPRELLARLPAPAWHVAAYEHLRLAGPDRIVQRVAARRGDLPGPG